MSDSHKKRLESLTSAMQEADLDAILLNPGPSLPYLSDLHFHISERPVIACFSADHAPTIVVPELEAQKLTRTPYPFEVTTYSEKQESWQPAFDAGLKHLQGRNLRVGIEPTSLRVLELHFIESALGSSRMVSASDTIAALRMRKDTEEERLMRKAVDIAEKALEDTLAHVRVGVSEREINAVLIQNLLRHGSDGELPFQPIIAFGANSANPHAVPTDYEAAVGDLILFDWGANYRGYFSDLTRTFALGEPDDTLKAIYEAVKNGNAAGRARVAPGVLAGDIDRAARETIELAGFGDKFVHRTGHGLGLEVHEDPYIRGDNDQKLDTGMTFTIEPGVYLNGHGGVRIEDDMIVTQDGGDSLSTFDRELRILPT